MRAAWCDSVAWNTDTEHCFIAAELVWLGWVHSCHTPIPADPDPDSPDPYDPV